MANLYVTLTEEITLPNNNVVNTNNFKQISGINQVVRKVDTISTTFSGSGVEVLKFVDSEEQQTAGSFVKTDVKYIRFTNLSTTGSAIIYLIKIDEESTLLNLDPGNSLSENILVWGWSSFLKLKNSPSANSSNFVGVPNSSVWSTIPNKESIPISLCLAIFFLTTTPAASSFCVGENSAIIFFLL